MLVNLSESREYVMKNKMVMFDRDAIDLFLFMGQSNMGGRGVVGGSRAETAPDLLTGAGFEYRAVSDQNTLHQIMEPFGKDENRVDGIDDGDKKTGSLVTAFVNSYYENTQHTIVGISASIGGSSILEWQPGGSFIEDVKLRMYDARQYLDKNGYKIRNTYMLWCQGETDGKNGMKAEEYKVCFEQMLKEMFNVGVEKCFLIRIGLYNGEMQTGYDEITKVQTLIAKKNPQVVMVSTDFASMKERGGMRDAYHYYQWAYNEVGLSAGKHTAEYVNTGKEPIMYDPYYNNTYSSISE